MRKESKKKYNEIIDYLYDKELETTSHYGERERAAAAESLKNVIHLTMILPVAVLVTIAVLSAVLSAAMPSRAILIIIILLVVLTIGGLAFYVMKTLLGSINTSNLSRRNLKRKYYKSGLSTNKDIRMLADINTFSYEGPDYNPLKVTYGDKDITEEYKACNNVLEQLELIDSLTIKL